jgi:prepilin-type N-terminal cleavage/methylation domain-containing protein
MKRKRKGFTLVELLVVIAIIALLMGILMPALARVRQIAFRMVCGSNLSGIGRAMLIYTNDYDNDLPRAGYTGTIWADQIPRWDGADRAIAYTGTTPFTGGNPGAATISASLYLLVKFAEVTPKSYVCKGESTRKAFKASDYQAYSTIPNMEDEEAWDFGPTNTSGLSPTNHCSYSYHMPYNQHFLSVASSEPGMAVAADRNPWLDPDTLTDQYVWNDHSKTTGMEIIKRYQKGNAGAHQREGQNVLFMDNHVYFENTASCGIDEDNIYTYNSGTPPPIQRGRELLCTTIYDTTYPVFAKDSLLVNECPTGGGTTTTTTTGPGP